MSVEQLASEGDSTVVSDTSPHSAAGLDVSRIHLRLLLDLTTLPKARRGRRLHRRPNTAIISLAAQRKIDQRLAAQATQPNPEASP